MLETKGDAVHVVPQSMDAVKAGNVVENEMLTEEKSQCLRPEFTGIEESTINRAEAQNTPMENTSTLMNEGDLNATTVTTESTTHNSASKRGTVAKAEIVPKFERHEYAKILPQLRGKLLDELRADIKQHGLLEPIVLYKGKILDGWNRALLCTELGIELDTREYEGDNPLGFVVSMNLMRRHLTAGQRAMIAETLATMPKGGDRKSEKIKPSIEGLISREEAAKQLNVSESSIERAHKVRTDGIPEVVAAVEEGEMSVSVAATLADATPEEQREIIALGDKKAISAAAKKVKPKKQHAKPEKCAQKIFKEILDTMEVVGKIPALFDAIRDNNLPHKEAELETLRGTVANDLEEIVAKVRSNDVEQAGSEPVVPYTICRENCDKNEEPLTEAQQTAV